MAEHPIEAHEYILKDMRERIAELEAQVQELMNWRAGSDEKLKTIFSILSELKAMLQTYTEDMRGAMKDLAETMNKKFGQIEKEIEDIKGRPGRKWDDFVRTLMTVLISLIVGALFSMLLRGTP